MSKPNILLFLVDELRYPTVYDRADSDLMSWMAVNLPTQKLLRDQGVSFTRHYVASTACAPSRTSLFTGQYPTLHGVTGTDGVGKHAWDRGMFWLDPDTVPTLGDWLRTAGAGYETYYKGKWHISMADLITPGTHDSVETNDDAGVADPAAVAKYENANRLGGYGFDTWVGPEPHGAAQSNCGWRRDPLYAQQMVALINQLSARPTSADKPLLLVSSFVNPHDIVLYGPLWSSWRLPVSDGTLDAITIAEPPTQGESLTTKPRAQASYLANYDLMFQDQPTDEAYRKFYYYLQKTVDGYVKQVYDAFRASRFYNDSIIIFTSDHGELLGAHGGMQQKWYQAYEEAIHVPLIIAGSRVQTPREITSLTSHVDLIPTILGLAQVDPGPALTELGETHTETQTLVGRNLASLVLNGGSVTDPVYFMTKDNVSVGIEQVTGAADWPPVDSPNHVETIVVDLEGSTWKYSRYFQEESVLVQYVTDPDMLAEIEAYVNVADQYEMYDLTADATETQNLANTGHAMEARLRQILDEQRAVKALTPDLTGTFHEQGEGLLTTATV